MMWSLGMKENAEFGAGLIIITLTVILTIISLSLFRHLTKKKANSLKLQIGFLSLVLIIGTLTYGLYHLVKFDLTIFLTIVMTLFSISGIILITKIGKEIFNI
jgi:heme/copper-type cytochrome/quinol oxidase subunit 4